MPHIHTPPSRHPDASSSLLLRKSVGLSTFGEVTGMNTGDTGISEPSEDRKMLGSPPQVDEAMRLKESDEIYEDELWNEAAIQIADIAAEEGEYSSDP